LKRAVEQMLPVSGTEACAQVPPLFEETLMPARLVTRPSKNEVA
jgi:hypothetical protein